MSSLTRLSALQLAHTGHEDAEGFEALTQLPALRRLDVRNVYYVPAWLGQVTGIQELVSVAAV